MRPHPTRQLPFKTLDLLAWTWIAVGVVWIGRTLGAW